MRKKIGFSARSMVQNLEPYAGVIGAWLKARGLSPVEAAPLLGVSHQTVYNWLDGQLPPLTRIKAIAKALAVSESKLRQLIERDQSKRHGTSGYTASSETPVDTPAEVHP